MRSERISSKYNALFESVKVFCQSFEQITPPIHFPVDLQFFRITVRVLIWPCDSLYIDQNGRLIMNQRLKYYHVNN